MNVTQLKAQDYQTSFSAFVVVCQFNSTVWTYMLTQLIYEGFKSRLPLLFSFSFLCFLYSNLIFFISESLNLDHLHVILLHNSCVLCTLFSLLHLIHVISLSWSFNVIHLYETARERNHGFFYIFTSIKKWITSLQ